MSQVQHAASDERHDSEGLDWEDREVILIVADYFAMLQKEMLGKAFNKTEHRNRLLPQLKGRSKGSVEFKHQNVSAVLVQMGLPYISGYKPRHNFQTLLGAVVARHLEQNAHLIDEFAASSRANPTTPQVVESRDMRTIVVDPPDRIITPLPATDPWKLRKGRIIDFAARDATNRSLGKLGEEFVLEYERFRLQSVGRSDLAGRVEWISQSSGDGIGFDILSFDEVHQNEIMIEVKATGFGKHFPFYVSENEVRCSDANPAAFHLYRVFDFGRLPKLYMLQGPLTQTCRLEPVSYRAVF